MMSFGLRQRTDLEGKRERLSGAIQAIEKENLVIDFQGGAFPVKFNDVKEIEKSHMPKWAKAAIAGGIGFAAFAIFMAAALAGD
jgi:hypothetical protein